MEVASSSVTTANYLPINLASYIRRLGSSSTQFGVSVWVPHNDMGQGKSEHAINAYTECKNTALDILYHGMRRGDSASLPGRITPEERVPGTNFCVFHLQHGRFGEGMYNVSGRIRTTILRTCGRSLFTTPTELCRYDIGPRDIRNHRTYNYGYFPLWSPVESLYAIRLQLQITEFCAHTV